MKHIQIKDLRLIVENRWKQFHWSKACSGNQGWSMSIEQNLIQDLTCISLGYLFSKRSSKRNDRSQEILSYSKHESKSENTCWSVSKGWFTMQGCIINIGVTLLAMEIHGNARMAPCWYHRNLSDAHRLGPEVNQKRHFLRWKDGEVPGKIGFIRADASDIWLTDCHC